MNKKNKELTEKYHEELWTRIGELEAGKVDEKELRISLPIPAHRATVTVSLAEAVVAIINHLGLELEKRPEVVAVKKKAN